MCSAKDWIQPPTASTYRNANDKQQKQSIRCKVRLHCIVTRRRSEGRKDEKMELRNLKLYLENRSIIQENERLRQKATRLMLENQALLSEYRKNVERSTDYM